MTDVWQTDICMQDGAFHLVMVYVTNGLLLYINVNVSLKDANSRFSFSVNTRFIVEVFHVVF